MSQHMEPEAQVDVLDMRKSGLSQKAAMSFSKQYPWQRGSFDGGGRVEGRGVVEVISCYQTRVIIFGFTIQQRITRTRMNRHLNVPVFPETPYYSSYCPLDNQRCCRYCHRKEQRNPKHILLDKRAAPWTFESSSRYL